ncbi:TRGV3 protein, partial [Calyptomena viridis]|nr:TRGV3 protein [Calyptomena viridis]
KLIYFLCSLSLDGQAQVPLKQSQLSVTKGRAADASMDCVAEGIFDPQYTFVHWYRHLPPRAPERILYIGQASVSYDDNSYRNKFSSAKRGRNVYTLKIRNINPDDEGTYYCACW